MARARKKTTSALTTRRLRVGPLREPLFGVSGRRSITSRAHRAELRELAESYADVIERRQARHAATLTTQSVTDAVDEARASSPAMAALAADYVNLKPEQVIKAAGAVATLGAFTEDVRALAGSVLTQAKRVK